METAKKMPGEGQVNIHSPGAPSLSLSSPGAHGAQQGKQRGVAAAAPGGIHARRGLPGEERGRLALLLRAADYQDLEPRAISVLGVKRRCRWYMQVAANLPH